MEEVLKKIVEFLSKQEFKSSIKIKEDGRVIFHTREHVYTLTIEEFIALVEHKDTAFVEELVSPSYNPFTNYHPHKRVQ